ncbi:hypothetical protein ACEWPM_002655 [Roseovarius sp. S4756]|uniref:hypothetical protein n=1 Tax=Roseovarius maritimus TaxID=3342637 RepID=UPI003726E56A
MAAVALSSAALVGCAAGTGTSGMQDVAVAFNSDSAPSGLVGYHATEIRVVKPSLKGHTNNHFAEITADCSMKGDGFTAAFKTPSTVKLPVFGSASKAVELSCANGSTASARTLKPVNVSQRARDGKASNTITGIILLSPIMIAGAAAAKVPLAADGKDIYGYDNVTINVK